MNKIIFLLILSSIFIFSCSKTERDSAKLSNKDGIWEIQSMTLTYKNKDGETITESYQNNGFFMLYNAQWYRHSLDMWDRYYGELKVTNLKNQQYDLIKLFNWFVDGDVVKVYEGESLEGLSRSYTFSKKGDEMTLQYSGENLFFYGFLGNDDWIQETYNLKRYDFK